MRSLSIVSSRSATFRSAPEVCAFLFAGHFGVRQRSLRSCHFGSEPPARGDTHPFSELLSCCAIAGLLATDGQEFGGQQTGPLKAAAPQAPLPHSIR
jgi:hypothetical protein